MELLGGIGVGLPEQGLLFWNKGELPVHCKSLDIFSQAGSLQYNCSRIVRTEVSIPVNGIVREINIEKPMAVMDAGCRVSNRDFVG